MPKDITNGRFTVEPKLPLSYANLVASILMKLTISPFEYFLFVADDTFNVFLNTIDTNAFYDLTPINV